MDALYLLETGRLAEGTLTSASAEHHGEHGADKVKARRLNGQKEPLASHKDKLCSIIDIDIDIDCLETPKLDDRSYRVIRLPNQLEALLVSDPYTDEANADLEPHVGRFVNKDNLLGIGCTSERPFFPDIKCFSVDYHYQQYLSALDRATASFEQPETRAMFKEQLGAMVGNKWIEVDSSQHSQLDLAGGLNGDPWLPPTTPFLSSTDDRFRISWKWPKVRRVYDTLKMWDSSAWTSLLEDAKELERSYEKTNGRWSEDITLVGALNVPAVMTMTKTIIDHLNSTQISEASAPPVPLKSLSSLTLQTIFRLAIPLTITLLPALASAAPSPGVPYRTPKILLVGTSALTSLSTGMTALQLEADPKDVRGTQLTRLALRVACSASLGTLAVTYVLCFLRWYARRKRAAFLACFWMCSFGCWVLVRGGIGGGGMNLREGSSGVLSGTAGTGGGGGGNDGADAFLWLDTFNLLGLLTVLAGILNAESSLFSSLFPHQGPTQAAGDEDGDNDDGDDGGDDGNGDGQRRGDEENQVAVRLRGMVNMNNGTPAADGMGNIRLFRVFSSLASSVLGS